MTTDIPAMEVVHRDDISLGRPSGATDGRLIYAIGDIHGCYEQLVALLAAITADARTQAAGASPLLVFLGDYVDRGPHSAKVLSTLTWLSRRSPFEVVFLKGNHEAMMLDFIDHPADTAGWLRVGGATTLDAYGVDVPEGEIPTERCEELRDALMDRLPASHLDLLRQLPTSLVRGEYAFVHAGFRPGVPLDRQYERDHLWIRDAFLDHKQPFEKIVVHGHSWDSDTPMMTDHRIGIDTGAYRTGALTAVRLGAPTIAFLQARHQRAAATALPIAAAAR